MNAAELLRRQELALAIAREAGDITLKYYCRNNFDVELKLDASPVTVADRQAEQHLRERIAAALPDDGILGEEFGERPGKSGFRWILDPIDGTKSFISGMPAWGTLIGLLRFGEPVFGMMHQPFTRERFSGDSGRAHYRGPAGKRDLRVRECTNLADALLYTTSPRLMQERDRKAFARVEDLVRLSRYGGDCYAYCMLAAGQIDLVIETELKPHDILPLVPVILGAGGVVTNWENGPPHAGGRVVVAGDKRVHEAALAALNS